MNSIATAVLSTGLVDPQIIEELRRWGALPTDLTVDGPAPRTPEEMAVRIQSALESEGFVLVRETDLAILDQYTTTLSQGTLHLVLDVDAEMQDADVPITFGRTSLNEYIVPWRSAGIQEVLTNGMTYLIDGEHRVFFRHVRELFFGDTKAFMICIPSYIERAPALAAAAEGGTGNVEHH